MRRRQRLADWFAVASSVADLTALGVAWWLLGWQGLVVVFLVIFAVNLRAAAELADR